MGSVRRVLDACAWIVLALALAAMAFCAWQWQRTRTLDAMIADGRIEKLDPLPDDARVQYAAAWFRARARDQTEAVRLFTLAQSASDPAQSAQAWLALGNVYFGAGVAASRDYEARVGPIFQNAQYDLARDAYRNALRIAPDLTAARYNLELLERMVPARHGDGWRRNTDPVMLIPEHHNGWTMMQDDKRRGLP